MFVWALAMALTSGELHWQAPPACPSTDTVQGRIDAAGGLGELVVDGRVVAEPTGWRLDLTITLGAVSDERTLRAATCDALAESMVLLVATRLDDVSEEPPPIPAPNPVPAPDPVPEPAPDLVPAPAPEAPGIVDPDLGPSSRPSLPTGLTLGAGAGVGLGSVPDPGVPSELALGHAWPRVRVAIRGRFHAARQIDVDPTRRMRVLLGTGGPQVCARLGRGRVEFPLCGEIAIGGSRAYTRGPARDRGGPWLEAGLGAGVAWFFQPRWALTGSLWGAVPLLGTGFELADETVWVPAAVGGRVMMGVEFLWPIQIGRRPEKSS